MDHVFKTVYWIDAGKQVIEAVNFDGTKRAVIISSGVSLPVQRCRFDLFHGMVPECSGKGAGGDLLAEYAQRFHLQVSKRASGLAVFENWVMWSEDGKNIRCRTDMQASCMNVTMHNVSDARHLKLLQPSLQPAG